MIIAAVGDTAYNIILLVHILTAMVAMAPLFLPSLLRSSVSRDTSAQQQLGLLMIANTRRFYGPALILSGLLGFALAGLSDQTYSMSDGWLLSAAVIWVVMNGVLHGVMLPVFKQLGSGQLTVAAIKRLSLGTGMMSSLLIVQLWLMIWKPGF